LAIAACLGRVAAANLAIAIHTSLTIVRVATTAIIARTAGLIRTAAIRKIQIITSIIISTAFLALIATYVSVFRYAAGPVRVTAAWYLDFPLLRVSSIQHQVSRPFELVKELV